MSMFHEEEKFGSSLEVFQLIYLKRSCGANA